MRTLLFIVFIALICVSPAIAKASLPDSIATVKLARRDADKFRYNKADKKFVKMNLHNPNSDYFKPTGVYASNPSLLSDSLYVKTFKYYAAKKTRARRTKTVLFIVGGGVVALAIYIAAASATAASSFL